MMELNNHQKEVLKSLRLLIHNDELDCENISTMVICNFVNDKIPKELTECLAALKVRAFASKTAIELLRELYPLFMDD